MKKAKLVAILKLLKIAVIVCALFFSAACKSDEAFDEKAEKTSVKTEMNVQMTNENPFGFFVQLEEDIFELPCTMQEILQKGWGNENLKNEKLKPQEFADVVFTKNDKQVVARVLNNTENEINAQDGIFCGITTRNNQGQANVWFAGGVGIASEKQKVLAVFGVPTIVQAEETEKAIYKVGKHSEMVFEFNDKGEVVFAHMQNIENETLNLDMQNLPQAVQNYVVPTQQPEDIFWINYAGDEYVVPVPIAKLLENGWKFETKTEKNIAPTAWLKGVALRRGNQILRTTIFNPEQEEMPQKHCWVSVLEAGTRSNTELEFSLSSGVTKTSSLQDVVSIYGETVQGAANKEKTLYYGQQNAGLTFKFNEAGEMINMELRKDFIGCQKQQNHLI